MRAERVAAAVIATSAVLTLGGVAAAASALTPERIQWLHDASVAASDPLPDDVAAIAAATGMSREGELVYRASTPAVEEESDFSEHCTLEGGAVLGCYAAGEIYVYDVTDARLAGTVEVTAAHEMLHAAYERLDEAERDRVDALVADFVATIPEDAPVRQDMSLYAPAQLDDEWHSRVGTEFAELPPALEEYYARWFDDRSRVLDLFATANAQFREIEARIDEIVAELERQDPILDAQIAALDADYAAYNADVAAFNRRAESGDFPSQAAFDSERGALVARGDALDARQERLQADIAAFNALVEELTALDADYADLYSALDPSDDRAEVEG